MSECVMFESSKTWNVLHENGDVLGRIEAGNYFTFDTVLGKLVGTSAVVEGMALYVQSRELDVHDVAAYEQGLIGRFGLNGSSFALFMGRTERERIYQLREVADAPDAATVA
jgi:hypothetical protein